MIKHDHIEVLEPVVEDNTPLVDAMNDEIRKSVARADISIVEDFLHSLPPDTLIDPDSLVDHIFAPGVYVRQMLLPAGSTVVGKIHKTRHVSIISHGRVTVVTENGEEVLTAPHTFINEPGERRVVCAHTDTIWTTIHPTKETDLKVIEDEVIAKTYEEFLEYQEKLHLEANGEV